MKELVVSVHQKLVKTGGHGHLMLEKLDGRGYG